MFQKVVRIVFILACIVDGKNSFGQPLQATTNSTWKLPKTDVNILPKISYASLNQVYDNYSLENREITFRDERLLTSRSLNTAFYDMPVYKSRAEWEKRKNYLKDHILVSTGLWPMPDKTPLRPVYYHKVDHPDYILETVTIETYPGFLLAGNIYRPKGKGRYPGILNSHGHFNYGRLNNDSINSIPARCINLARQGYVVFAYDMVGYNDTRQVPHNFADDSISHLYGINVMGLQLWNSIRALDFLTSLPSVDTSRIGITGASGGATQVFLLTGVDNRFHASAPVNMISATMQGGDVCENAPGLRTNTYNVEIGAMVAPKPLLMISDTYDWTFNTRNTLMPRMKAFFSLYGAVDNVTNKHYDFVHNYNKASRGAMYAFFGKQLLHQPDESALREKPFVMDTEKDLLAFMNEKNTDRIKTFKELNPLEFHNAPKLDDAGLKAQLKEMYLTQLSKNWPTDNTSHQKFRAVYGTAIKHLLQATMPDAVSYKLVSSAKGENFVAHQLLIARKDINDWIPCTLYQPLSPATSTVIMTSDAGRASAIEPGEAKPNNYIVRLLAQKCNVLVPDLFKQGEHTLQAGTKTKRDESDKHFTAYNLTDRQEQIQDLLTIIKAIKVNGNLSQKINLLATGNTGLTGLLLSTLTNDISKTILDGDQFDPTTDENMLKLQIPGIMRIGGLKTVAAFSSNQNMLIYNAHPSLKALGATEVSKLANNSRFSISTENEGVNKITDFLIH